VAFRHLFLEVLRLAVTLGVVKLGNLSTDGTKMGANASRHKAMSYGYMNKEIERLKAEIVSGGQGVCHYRRASSAIPRLVDRGFGSLQFIFISLHSLQACLTASNLTCT